MKIYDKKGLLLGIGLILFGIINLFYLHGSKGGLFWPVLLIIFGIFDCFRCLSRKKTQKHFIEEMDERNKLVTLTSKAKTLDIMQLFCFVMIVLSTVAWKQSGNAIFGGMLIMAGLSILFITVVEVITGIYYEEKK